MHRWLVGWCGSRGAPVDDASRPEGADDDAGHHRTARARVGAAPVEDGRRLGRHARRRGRGDRAPRSATCSRPRARSPTTPSRIAPTTCWPSGFHPARPGLPTATRSSCSRSTASRAASRRSTAGRARSSPDVRRTGAVLRIPSTDDGKPSLSRDRRTIAIPLAMGPDPEAGIERVIAAVDRGRRRRIRRGDHRRVDGRPRLLAAVRARPPDRRVLLRASRPRC